MAPGFKAGNVSSAKPLGLKGVSLWEKGGQLPEYNLITLLAASFSTSGRAHHLSRGLGVGGRVMGVGGYGRDLDPWVPAASSASFFSHDS